MAAAEAIQHADNHMIQDCTAQYMMKMNRKQECVKHLAYVADPQSTVAQLSHACDALNERFTVQDARRLCTDLAGAHAAFWSQLM
jgi:hypothetical protein